MSNLKLDLDHDEVFVFTPNGEVVTLEAQATPVDFAYTIHTEVGHSCRGARVNNRLVQLTDQVYNEDQIQLQLEGLQVQHDFMDFLSFLPVPWSCGPLEQDRKPPGHAGKIRRRGEDSAPQP